MSATIGTCDGAHDRFQRQRRFLVRAGDAHDVGARRLQRLDLADGRLDVGRQRVRHRLHGDRRVAADLHVADADLAALAAGDVAIGADAHGVEIASGGRRG